MLSQAQDPSDTLAHFTGPKRHTILLRLVTQRICHSC